MKENCKAYVSRLEVQEILHLLEENYPQAQTALQYDSVFELLLAAILSAQTTDRQVNAVTSKFFPLIKEGPSAVLAMGRERLEKAIKGCGLYRQKSHQILETSRILVEKFAGKVPRNREELVSLPGVGRKTANIILSTAYGIPAFAVDTHVMRVSRRLGLVKSKTVRSIEDELCALIPPEYWEKTHHRLIAHGRRICRARSPLCDRCFLDNICRFNTPKQALKN